MAAPDLTVLRATEMASPAVMTSVLVVVRLGKWLILKEQTPSNTSYLATVVPSVPIPRR